MESIEDQKADSGGGGGSSKETGGLVEELAGLKEDSKVAKMVEWMEGAGFGRRWESGEKASTKVKVPPLRSVNRELGAGSRSPTGSRSRTPPGGYMPGPPAAPTERSSLLFKEYTYMDDSPYCDELGKSRLLCLPVLDSVERAFLELVKLGEVEAVRDYISRNPSLNINCGDYKGHTALHLAVKRDNLAMIEFLLSQPTIYIGDAYMLAIKLSSLQVVEAIMDRADNGHMPDSAPGIESNEFPALTSPLVMAAISGRYEIVSFLLDRGYTISHPHPPECMCLAECRKIMTDDPLRHAAGKLRLYKAISNPCYICQTSEDPILTAFELSEELRRVSQIDSIYRRDYEALSKATKNFAVAFIAECRSSYEVETILTEKRGCHATVTYPRLILAMDYKQKDFVSHPNVQMTLLTAWYGSWQGWRMYGLPRKLMVTLPRFFIVPFLPLLFLLAPNSQLAKFYMIPINVMLNYSAAYAYFLIFVFLQSNINKKHQNRDMNLTALEITLLIFMIGFFANTVRMLLMTGARRFFGFVWNVHAFIMELLFFLIFFFWLYNISYASNTVERNAERKYWHFLDPELIAEALFVIFTVVAFLRVLLIAELSHGIGPLQVTLAKMIIDCVRYSVVFTVLLLAFSAGLSRYYSYYEGMKQRNPLTGDEISQEGSFISFMDTIKTLFWGIFGMSSFENADVIIENLPDQYGSKTVINEHYITKMVGYFTFAIYMILTVVVLLNMLIATMSNTYQRVSENVDSEWIFGRTQVFLVFFDHTILPVPYNLLPTGYGLFSVRSTKLNKSCPWCCPPTHTYYIPEEHRKLDFKLLNSQLVQRYFRKKIYS